MDRNTSDFALRTGVGIFWVSTAILIILAIFGVGLDGIAIGPFDVPPFILYLLFHSIVMLGIMISRSEYILDIPSPMFILLLFAMYVIGSSFWASDTVSAIKEMTLIVASIATGLFVYWSVTDRRTLSKYLSVLKLLALVGLVIAAFEITTGTHLPISKRYGTATYYKSTAWYVNENDFSMFLSMISFFFFTNILLSENSKSRILGTGGFIGCLVVLLVNEARAALLAVFVVSMLLVGLHLSQGTIRSFVSEPIKLPVFTAGALVGGFVSIVIALAASNPFDPQSSYSLWFRWQALEAGTFLLFDTVIGSGAGSFPTQWGQLEILPATGANAHNWFVTLIGEYGFVGTALFLLAYGWTADGLIQRYIRYRDPAAFGLLGVLLAFAIAGLGPSNSIIFQIQWIIFGLSIALLFRVPE